MRSRRNILFELTVSFYQTAGNIDLKDGEKIVVFGEVGGLFGEIYIINKNYSVQARKICYILIIDKIYVL